MKALRLALAGLVACPSPIALAGDLCATGVCAPQQLVQAQSVGYAATGYAQPVQYATSYAAATYSPLVIGVPVANLELDYYYKVGQEGREEQVLEKALELLEKLEARRPAQVQIQTPPPPAQPQYTPPVLPVVPAKPSPQSPASPDLPPVIPQPGIPPVPAFGGGDPSTSPVVGQIFSTSCLACHKPGSTSPGNIQLANADGTPYTDPDPLAEYQRRSRILDSVLGLPGAHAMPKGQDPLPREEVAELVAWKRSLDPTITAANTR